MTFAPLESGTMRVSRPRSQVTVLVTAHQDTPRLYECLRAVRSQAEKVGAETLLVLNVKQKDFPREAEEALSQLCTRILFVEIPGKSNALNEGIATIDSEVVAFIDDDAEPQPGWLASLIAPLLDDQRPADLVGTGGRVLPIYPERGMPRWYRDMIELKKISVLGPRHDLGDAALSYSMEGAKTPNPIGANCAYRRELFLKYEYAPDLGPNYETGLCGGEDTELAHRLMLDGNRLDYVPESIVHHAVRPDRLSLEFCARRFYSHGVELTRIRQRLQVAMRSRQRLHWERRLLLFLYIACPFGLGWSHARIVLQREKLRGMIDETDRAPRSIEALLGR